MSIFRCNICDEQVDSDYYGCYEDPEDVGELICDSCNDELEDENVK